MARMHKGKPHDQLMPFRLSIKPPLLLGMREGQLDLTIENLGNGTEMLVLAESSTLVVKPVGAARRIISDAGSTTASFRLAAKELKRQRHQIRLTFDFSGRTSSSIVEVEQVDVESLNKWETTKLLVAEFFRKPRIIVAAFAGPALIMFALFMYDHWPAPTVTVLISVNGQRPQGKVEAYLDGPNGVHKGSAWTDESGKAIIRLKPWERLNDYERVCVSFPSQSEPNCNYDPTNQPAVFQLHN